jgi:hypothetical protein
MAQNTHDGIEAGNNIRQAAQTHVIPVRICGFGATDHTFGMIAFECTVQNKAKEGQKQKNEGV